VDLTKLVDTALAELQEEANQQGTTLMHQRPESAISVEADATHLAMAIKALCINSLEAVSAGGSIRVSTRPQLSNDGRWGAVVEVSDSGPGIPENVRPHLFDPFFSGREAGRGLGLGLSKCWRIVTLHQGLIEVDSSGQGATFTIWLPQQLEAA
jgi:signal transduction histidine kinase